MVKQNYGKHINFCQPNQAYSVKELLERSLNGAPLPPRIGSPDPFGKYDDMSNQERISDISQVLANQQVVNQFHAKALEFEKRQREKESQRIQLLKQYQDEYNDRQQKQRDAYVQFMRQQNATSLDVIQNVPANVSPSSSN